MLFACARSRRSVVMSLRVVRSWCYCGRAVASRRPSHGEFKFAVAAIGPRSPLGRGAPALSCSAKASHGTLGDRALRGHPHRASSRIDAIAQGCERPKRCGASFALQASRIAPRLPRKRDTSARERFRCYCGSGADGVLCWACSKADLTKRGAGINNGDFHFAAKKLQCVSLSNLRHVHR